MNRVSSKKADALIRFGATAAAITIAAGLPAGCAPFDVNVGTEEALKVDLNLDVNVYQHGPDEKKKDDEKKKPAGEDEDAESAANDDAPTYQDVVKGRRDRQDDIWEFKGNRFVGESRQGLLKIINEPGADWGTYVHDTVKAENRDRNFIYRYEAAKKGVPEDEIRRKIWRQWQLRSNPGEWIEVETDGELAWVKKQGAAEKEPENGG